MWYDTRDEVCLGRDDTSPPPWREEGREHSPNSVQLYYLMCPDACVATAGYANTV